MKCLVVYQAGDKWFGSDVSWKRSGSGTYRETTPIEVPQSREGIEALAKEFGYSLEWRDTPPPKPQRPAAIAVPKPETAAGLT
jgi:hypothetical protein